MSKIIQIVAEPDSDCSTLLYALKDDGTIWKLVWNIDQQRHDWKQLPEPPK